ncbi:MAG: segregation and condensation protein A [Mangrovicoccus sp.]
MAPDSLTPFSPDAEAIEARLATEALIVELDGFEGPLDLLLAMSRTAKIDLRQISVLALSEQYLDFIERAQELRIELAADYLVMAAWLAFLKSKLLLPAAPEEDGPSAEDLAAHLAFQLERLQAMRTASSRLMARDRLGRDVFARGAAEPVTTDRKVEFQSSLLDLLQAYARIRTRDNFRPFVMDREAVMTMEEALERMRDLIGYNGGWEPLAEYLPPEWQIDAPRRRASLAATFAASLEMAKQGQIEIRQAQTFAPIELRVKGAA